MSTDVHIVIVISPNQCFSTDANLHFVLFFLQKAKESGTSVQIPPAQPPAQSSQPQQWEPLGEPSEPKPAPKGSPSDDLLQLNAMFSAPLQQSSSTAFSQSPSFPPSQAFPAAQGFGQAPSQAGAWSGPAATTGRPVCGEEYVTYRN